MRSRFVGALTAAVMVGAGMATAPVAVATCASAFGLSIGSGCSSTLTTVALAIGPGATARATGLLGAALAIGNSGTSVTSAGLLNAALAIGTNVTADTQGTLSAAAVIGNVHPDKVGQAATERGGIANVALLIGRNAEGQIIGGLSSASPVNVANLAVSFFAPSFVETGVAGVGNLVVNAFGSANTTGAIGWFNVAATLFGSGNTIRAFRITDSSTVEPAYGSVAFNLFANSNKIEAGPGPLSVAGSIRRSRVIVTQVSPGINIQTRLAVGAAQSRSGQPVAATAHHSVRSAAAAASRHLRAH